MKMLLVGVLAVAASGCGRSAADQWIDVGAFQIPVLDGWHRAGAPGMGKDWVMVAINDREGKPALDVTANPIELRAEIDPASLETCQFYAENIDFKVAKFFIADLPFGKACTLDGAVDDKKKRVEMTAKVNGHGVQVRCDYELAADKKLCDAVFQRVRMRK